MPSAPMRVCRCGTQYPSGHGCPSCSRNRHRNPVHGSQRWRRTSKANLARHPLCVGYPKGFHHIPTMAQCTDHVIGVEKRPDLAFEPTNFQSLCNDCNKRKAIAEEGGLGR